MSSPVKLRGLAKRSTSARSSATPVRGWLSSATTARRSGKSTAGASALENFRTARPGEANDGDRRPANPRRGGENGIPLAGKQVAQPLCFADAGTTRPVSSPPSAEAPPSPARGRRWREAPDEGDGRKNSQSTQGVQTEPSTIPMIAAPLAAARAAVRPPRLIAPARPPAAPGSASRSSMAAYRRHIGRGSPRDRPASRAGNRGSRC